MLNIAEEYSIVESAVMARTAMRKTMPEFDFLTYVFDFSDKRNCSRVENAAPDKEISVLVHAEPDKLGARLAGNPPPTRSLYHG